jgi:hypothetical protein
MRFVAAAEISSTARSNATWLIFEGALKPLSFRTNCNEALRISSGVAGGSKLNRVLMFLHTGRQPLRQVLMKLLRSAPFRPFVVASALHCFIFCCCEFNFGASAG